MKKSKQYLCLAAALCLIPGIAACKDTEKEPVQSGTSTAAASTASEDDGIFELESGAFGPESSAQASAAAGSKSVSSAKTPEYQQETDISKLPQYVQDAYKKLPNLKTDAEKTVTIMYNDSFAVSQLLGYKYGIKNESIVVPSTELLTRYITMVNGGKAPDIIASEYNFSLISRQRVETWDKYIDFSAPMWDETRAVNANFAMGGKRYMLIPSDPARGGKVTYCLYNADVIRAAKLETPDELFQKGAWDWNALTNIAERMTSAPNRFGIWMYNGPQAFINATGHDYIDFENGRPKNMVNNAAVARAIQAYSGLVAKKAVTLKTSPEEMLKKGEVAMMIGTYGSIMAVRDLVEKGTIGFTATPKDPQADKHYSAYMSNGFYLGKGAKHPNNAAAYMTVWYYEHQAEYRRQFNQQQLKNGKGTPEKIYNKMMEIDAKTAGTMHTWAMFGSEFGIYVSAVGSALNGGEPWSKIAAELSPLADAGIKNFYGS